jgi:hypothetical protein
MGKLHKIVLLKYFLKWPDRFKIAIVSSLNSHLLLQNILLAIVAGTLFLTLMTQAHATGSVTSQPWGVSPPLLENEQGDVLLVGSQGTPSLLSVNAYNAELQPIQLVAIVEVRNEDGISLLIEFEILSLASGERANVQVPWTPDSEGIYELRSFAISDWESPEYITLVESQEIPVRAG